MTDDFMTLLFGKKKRRRRTSTKKTKGRRKLVKRGYCVRKGRVCKVYDTKEGSKIVKRKHLRNGKRCNGTVYSKKTTANRKASSFGRAKSKRTMKKKPQRRKKYSSFGTSGEFVPLEAMMSPYPSSVDMSTPWI